jgi:hypothetical protein
LGVYGKLVAKYQVTRFRAPLQQAKGLFEIESGRPVGFQSRFKKIGSLMFFARTQVVDSTQLIFIG